MSASNLPCPSSLELNLLLTDFDASGQSAASFARLRGIPSWKLYNALSRRRGKVRRARDATRSDRPALIAVRVTEAKAPALLELLVAGGHRLLISADFDAELLRRVVGALAQC